MQYDQGVLSGASRNWYENGRPKGEGTFAAGKYHGTWTFWDVDGVQTTALFEAGQKVTGDGGDRQRGVELVDRDAVQPSVASEQPVERAGARARVPGIFEAACDAPRLIVVLEDGEVVDGTFIKEVKLGLLVETKDRTLLVKRERISDVEARCVGKSREESSAARVVGGARDGDGPTRAPSRELTRTDPVVAPAASGPSMAAGAAALGAMFFCGVGPIGGIVAWVAAVTAGKRRIPILPLVGMATAGCLLLGCVNVTCSGVGTLLSVGGSGDGGAQLAGFACFGLGLALSSLIGLGTAVATAILAGVLGRDLAKGESTYNLDLWSVPDVDEPLEH